MTSRSPLCLMTDFGLNDHYVGVMKGILLGRNPDLPIIDLTHQIEPHDIRAGAYELLASYQDFPEGTFFISVVDPGVGSSRKILYGEAGHRKFMAPDNGLLSWVFEHDHPSVVYSIDSARSPRKDVSSTFHGRDVFAPVASELSAGASVKNFGEPTKEWVKLPFPMVKKLGSTWTAEVIYIDRFGNLITNLRYRDLKPLATSSKIWIEVGRVQKQSIRGLTSTYSEAEKGRPLATESSAGFLEIAVREGNAAHDLNVQVGDSVKVEFRV